MINETDCQKCSHKNICNKKDDYMSYILSVKETEYYRPGRVCVIVRCEDFSEVVSTPKSNRDSNDFLCAPGFGSDRPKVDYSNRVE